MDVPWLRNYLNLNRNRTGASSGGAHVYGRAAGQPVVDPTGPDGGLTEHPSGHRVQFGNHGRRRACRARS